MAVTRSQKTEQLKNLKEKLANASSVIFANYIGLTVSEVSELRRKLKEGKAEMKVAKKTLMRIASKESNLPEISEDNLPGPVACIFSFDDPLSGAQIAFRFAKEHKQVSLVGGLFEGKILSKQEALSLAQMPNRETLLATFMSMIRSPLTSFASICSSPLLSFARMTSELASKGGMPKS